MLIFIKFEWWVPQCIYYVIFLYIMLYTLRYFEIKIFNLTVPLTVVWLETVYEIFFFFPKQNKTILSQSCHSVVTQLRMLASLTDLRSQKSHPQIKKQIASLGIKVGWSLLSPGRDLQCKWGHNTGLVPMGLKWKLGIQSEDWWELAEWWKMPSWHPAPSLLAWNLHSS